MNDPEWVEPDEDPTPPRPPDERVVTMQTVRATLDSMRTAAQIVNNGLLRLDEMGEPTKRARVRAGNLADYIAELDQIFNYDIQQQMGKRTADQKVRAERHELS